MRDRLRGMADEEFLKLSGLMSWKLDETQSHNQTQTTASSPASPSPLYSKFRNRVMFPICNEQGKVIAFTGRTLDTNEKSGPKYLNSPETPVYSKGLVLFNLDKAKDAIRHLGYAILVEGNVDCISVFTAGFQNVIATSGTAFSEPLNQAGQFFAGRKAQEDGPGYLVQFLNHAIPIQLSASLGSRVVIAGRQYFAQR